MLFGILISVVWVLLDQWSKHWAVGALSHGASLSVLGHYLRLTYVENDGAAFGIFAGQKLFFIVLSIGAILFLLFVLWRHRKDTIWFRLAMGMILGGAAGNFIDRMRWGYVVDFIQVDIIRSIQFPVFNVADIGVTVGVFFLAVLLLRTPDEQGEKR